jgi:hypothetical protein
MLGVAVGILLGILGTSLASRHSPKLAIGPERYLQGYQHHDAHLIWTSYSEAAQEQLVRRGQTEQATVEYYQWLGSRPGTIDRVEYLGGHQAPDGGEYLYLVAGHRDDGSPFEATWYFVTDPDGLIRSIL